MDKASLTLVLDTLQRPTRLDVIAIMARFTSRPSEDTSHHQDFVFIPDLLSAFGLDSYILQKTATDPSRNRDHEAYERLNQPRGAMWGDYARLGTSYRALDVRVAGFEDS